MADRDVPAEIGSHLGGFVRCALLPLACLTLGVARAAPAAAADAPAAATSAAAPSAPSAAAPASPAPAPAPPRRIDFLEFRVEGNTVLPQREIEEALYEFLGPDRPVTDAEKARAALEELYSKRGYPTVSATLPPQSGEGGLVIIKVVERPVGQLRVVGSKYVAPSTIRGAAPSLQAGKVPHLPDVQNDLVALNQLPDRTVTPALKPGLAPDTVDVDLKVDDSLPFHGTLELNNRRSQDTTALRTLGSLSYNNLWQRGDAITAGFQVAPSRPNDATIAYGSYLFRIPNSRLTLTASYLHSDSNVTTVGSTNVVGAGDIAGLTLTAPLAGSADFTQSVSAGLAWKSLTENVGVGSEFTQAPVEYVPFTVAWNGSWQGSASSTDAQAGVTWAFRGLGSDTAAFDSKRLYGQPNFTYVKADVAHTHTLPYDIQLYARGQFQASAEPLISSEQLSVGGQDTVRGYLESEALGDVGGIGTLEVRSPPLTRYIGGPLTALRFRAFVDAGATKLRRAQLEQRDSETLASTGVGFTMRLWDHFGASLDDAQVLRSGPNTRSGVNRVLFRLYGDF